MARSLDQIRGKPLVETIPDRSGGELSSSTDDHVSVYHIMIRFASVLRVESPADGLCSRQLESVVGVR